MKFILLFISAATLLTTSGCFFPGRRGGEYREHGEYRGHREYREVEHREYVEPGVTVRVHAE